MAVLIKLGDNLVPVNSLIIGGKEPNLQEKNVDITSNGTIEVLPDGEYTGLSKVNINANVPDSIPYIKAMIDGSEYVGDIVIPNNATEIMPYAFYGRSNLKGGLTLPDNLTSIKDYAFYNCSGIVGSLNLKNVMSLGNYCFNGCTQLSGNLIIPNNITKIPSSAFSGCSGLTSITIGNSVTSIGNSAFSRCSGLTSITIGNSVTSIGNYAFNSCSGLTSLTIPANVKTVGGNAFQSCSGLTSLTIEEGVEKLGESNFVNYTFQACANISGEVIIPSTINYIANGTFDGCKKIEKFTYKAQVPSIPSNCFYFCTGCKTFKCETAITAIGQNTFYTCSAMELYDFRNCTVVPTLADTTLGHKDGCQIVVPDALYDEWIAATNWSSLTNVVFVKASEYVEV